MTPPPDRPPLPPGPYLVLGLARSGEAAALALRARGQHVIGYDRGSPENNPGLAATARRLRTAGVEVQLDATGDHLPEQVRTLVKSPGVPQSALLVRVARDRGLVVLGELELAWRLLANDFIAVTGTNGKTTTTEWIGHIHRCAELPVAVAGNVGTALSTLIDAVPADRTIVCEASSFQLEDTIAFDPQVAVLLNLTPDHLDRHGTFENYRDAKLQIFAHQRPDDVAVITDELNLEIGGEASEIRFGSGPEAALRLAGDELRWRGARLVGTAEIRLPGAHNLQNAMAAAAACLSRGIEPESVAEGLKSFAGVRHRLEPIAEVGGVRYVNDSKATNVASTLVALQSYPGGVHLILGGQGKSQDFSSLVPAVTERCAGVYLIGEDAAEIARALEGAGPPVQGCGTLEAAVGAASLSAGAGEVVLLSPACASFDQFRDFEARGDAFRELVLEIAATGGQAPEQR